MRMLFLIPATLALSGCVVGTIASTAVNVVTLPVKVASAGVDAVTTSQSEADEQRGRTLRKKAEQRGKAMREAQQRCHEGRQYPSDNCAVFAPR